MGELLKWFQQSSFYQRRLRVIFGVLSDILYLARLGLSFESIGTNLIRFFELIGGLMVLFVESVIYIFIPPYRFREVLRQMSAVGFGTLALIVFVLSFLGMITVLELNFQLSRVIGNISYVPGFAGILMFREFGPTVVSAMVAAKVGAGFSAELGNMKISEQIDALELASISPVKFLVVPRFIATLVMQVSLCVIGVGVAFFSGFLVSSAQFSFSYYYTTMAQFVKITDLGTLLTKALILGCVVPIVSCYYGLRCKPGAKGVGEATTKTVVSSILIIIVLDFILNASTWQLLNIVLE